MATLTNEREIKYAVPPGFVLPDLSRLPEVASVGDPSEVALRATYYDTPDLRLVGHGVTLRRRAGGSDAGWHLKQPVGPHHKTETRVDSAGRREVPPELDERVRALRRRQSLRPVARIRTRRLERPVRDARGRVLAVVADDQVASETLRGTAVLRQWRELEVELVDGSPKLLAAVDKLLRSAGVPRSDSPSKLHQALGVGGPPPRPGRGLGSGGRALRDYLRAQRDRLLETDPGVRHGDPGAVHDMRVAARRLRATLRSFRPVLDADRTEPVRAELRWLAHRLGAVRDSDVLGERLDTAVHAEPPELVLGPVAAMTRSRLAAADVPHRERLVVALDSPRYAALLDTLDALVDDPPFGKVKAARLRRRARKALRRADLRLDRAAEAIAGRSIGAAGDAGGRSSAGSTAGRSAVAAGAAATGATASAGPSLPGLTRRQHPDVLLHEARKAYRRARYAVEVLRPVAGGPARKLARRLSRLQDVLGEHHDAVTASAALRDHGVHAHLDGENGFTYGLLHARQHTAAGRALAALPAARRRATRAKRRRWL